MKDHAVKEKFIELRAQGFSFQKIARDLTISKQTAINWARELRITIHNHKTLELEALYEKHLLTTQNRVEFYAEQLNKMKQELSKRDYNNVPTERLIEMMLKFTQLIGNRRENLIMKEERDFMAGNLETAIHSYEVP